MRSIVLILPDMKYWKKSSSHFSQKWNKNVDFIIIFRDDFVIAFDQNICRNCIAGKSNAFYNLAKSL